MILLELDPELAGHVAVALHLYRSRLAAAGIPRPSGLVDLQEAMKRAADGGPGKKEEASSGAVALAEQAEPRELFNQAEAAAKLMVAIRDACDAEFPGIANVYVDKLGRVCAHGRFARFDPVGVSFGTDWNFRPGRPATAPRSRSTPIGRRSGRRSPGHGRAAGSSTPRSPGRTASNRA